MDSILRSMQACPILMRLFFRNLTKRAYEHFGDDCDVSRYSFPLSLCPLKHSRPFERATGILKLFVFVVDAAVVVVVVVALILYFVL